MSDHNPAIGQAGSLLYEASQAFVDAVTAAGSDLAGAENRKQFLTAMRTLAVYVAEGDGILSAGEAYAINQIFWLDQLGTNNAYLSTMLVEHPDRIDACIAYLEQNATFLDEHAPPGEPADPDQNLIRRAVDLVLGTVLAHDESAEPEVARLTAITSRLRQKVSDGATAQETAGTGAADTLATIRASLDLLVGLANVKQQVETLTNLARVFQIRREMGLPVPPMSFHLVFLGNPGTGKTTVARIIAQLYGKLGLLSKGQLIEVDRSGLVANYIGQTATKVDAVVEKAMGGVLFIDEAYALDGHDTSDFGHEAVATLIKAMEDHRSDLVVIAAGYTDQMQGFLDLNPGIRSRMGRDLVFDDYTPPEMTAIFRSIAGQAGYILPERADAILTSAFQRLWDARGKDFANARDVRNRFERVIEAQANRLCSLSRPTATDKTTITGEDLLAGLGIKGPDQPTIDLSIVTASSPAMSQLPPA